MHGSQAHLSAQPGEKRLGGILILPGHLDEAKDCVPVSGTEASSDVRFLTPMRNE